MTRQRSDADRACTHNIKLIYKNSLVISVYEQENRVSSNQKPLNCEKLTTIQHDFAPDALEILAVKILELFCSVTKISVMYLQKERCFHTV